jgi:hypothetical protein
MVCSWPNVVALLLGSFIAYLIVVLTTKDRRG